jgi:hypothetical protein
MGIAVTAGETCDIFLVAQRAATRFGELRDAMKTLFAQVGATRLRSVDVYYRSETDVALVALHLDRSQLSPLTMAQLEGSAMRAQMAVLEPARLPSGERARFYQSYLPQYRVRLERLAAPDDAISALEEHLAATAQRAQAASRGDSLEVRFRRGDAWQLGRVRALTRETIYVSTGGPPRRGDVIEVMLSLGPAQLIVHAGVLQVTAPDSAHAHGAPGFGAQLLVAGPADVDRIDKFMAYLAKHLPPERPAPPRRRDVRYPVRWPVTVDTDGGPTGSIALDLSRHGLFLAAHTSTSAAPDTRLELAVPMDDGGAAVRVGARVARTVTPELARERGVPTGFGLEIVSLAPREEGRFGRFLLRIGRRAGHTILVGASPDRAAPIVAELTAAGYAAAQVSEGPVLVKRLAVPRPPDLVLLDASLLRADPHTDEAIRRAAAPRGVPVVHVDQDTPRGARSAADLALLS